MRPRHLYALLLAFALLFSLQRTATAQDTSTPPATATSVPTDTPTPTATATLVPTPTDSVEVAVLKAQLETMKEYDARNLAIVSDTKNVLILIATLLVGYSIFANLYQFDKARKDLKREIVETSRAQVKEAEASMQQTFDNVITAIDAKYAEELGDVWSNLKQEEVNNVMRQRRYNKAISAAIEWMQQSQKLKHSSGELFSLGLINFILTVAKLERRKVSIVESQYLALIGMLKKVDPQIIQLAVRIQMQMEETAKSVQTWNDNYEDPPEPESK